MQAYIRVFNYIPCPLMALGWQEKIWMKFFPTSFNVWNLQNWYAFQGLIMFVWGENLTYFKLESLFFVRDHCLWIPGVTLSHEFTSPWKFNKLMNCTSCTVMQQSSHPQNYILMNQQIFDQQQTTWMIPHYWTYFIIIAYVL